MPSPMQISSGSEAAWFGECSGMERNFPMEILQISALLAEEIRKEVFLFAADRIQTDPQHKELMYYGGML